MSSTILAYFEAISWNLTVDVVGALAALQCFAPKREKRGGGTILLTGSWKPKSVTPLTSSKTFTKDGAEEGSKIAKSPKVWSKVDHPRKAFFEQWYAAHR